MKPAMKVLDRRTLLRGAGGVGIALPFLNAMWPGRARAATLPRRLFVMTGNNGVTTNTWFPTGAEKDFKLGESMVALEPLKSNLIIVDGVDRMERGPTDGTAHGRGAASALSGWTSSGKNGIPDGASIDQVVANAIGGGSRVKSLITGNKVYNYYFFADGPKQVHPVEPDPQKNFDRLFTGFTPPTSTGGADPADAAAAARLRARDKSVLDAAMEQYRKVSQKVGVADRQRLEKHLGAIRQVEAQIGNAAGGMAAATKSCTKPPAPAPAPGPDVYQAFGKANLELTALAFACDLTRVGGLQWISHNQVFSWLGVTQQHHPLSHSHGTPAVDAQLTKIVGWHAEQAASFLTQLKGFSEGEGTVLDNTLFFWTNEQSVGSHRFNRGPFLLASGKFPLATGGILQTGRYVKYPNGTPHTSILQAITMAIANVKMPVFGGWDKGPLPGLLTGA
jgi:hypothetical protein